jgi:ABC-type multidrug transport system fused ATPase/permease subunit
MPDPSRMQTDGMPPADGGGPWRSYLRLYRPFTVSLLLSVGCTVLQSLAFLPMTFLVRRLFNGIQQGALSAHFLATAFGIMAFLILSGALSLVARHIAVKATKHVIQALRLRLSRHAHRVSDPVALGDDRTGFQVAIVHGTEQVDTMTVSILTGLLPAVITSVLLLACLLVLNQRLALGMFVVLPLVIVVNRLLSHRQRCDAAAFQKVFGHFNQGVAFSIRMVGLIALRGTRDEELRELDDRADVLRRVSGHMAWFGHANAVVQRTTMAVAGIFVVILGGYAIASGEMSFGDLAAFYFVMTQLTNGLNTLWSSVPPVIVGNAALRKIHQLLALPVELVYQGTAPVELAGHVELRRVSFAYGDRVIASNLSLSLAPGRITAITGSNGTGKTTLAYLILGLIAPGAGAVHAEGVPYDRLDIEALRRQIGFVPQEPMLFVDTLLRNVTYGRSAATEREIAAALRLSTADAFVDGLPDGERTWIGEGGVVLSGGQNQRIAIARALLGQPRLLILDEPTNHLDAASIAQLLHNVATLDPAPAVMLITHDPSVAALAHEHYELRDGILHPRRTTVSGDWPGAEIALARQLP